MKLKKLFLYLVLLILVFTSANSLAQQDNLKKIDAFIANAMGDWKMPGFSVAIVKNDSVIFAKGYGVKDINKKEPVDENTLFVIASCSKAFTTASLAILVDAGKLKWDDPVTKHLPDFQMYDSWVTKEMTVRDLVTHRSGLSTFSGDFLWLSSTYDAQEVIRRGRYLKPTSSFRSRYGYQNIMYIAAAEIIRSVTDTSWADYIRTHILNPLGMNHTNTSYSLYNKDANAAKAHYQKGDIMKIYTDVQQDNAHGALGLNSSAIEMAQWIRLQLGKGTYNKQKIFSERQSMEMWMNHMATGNSNYGLGWAVSYKNGKKTLSHGGGMPGMISQVTIVPEENFGFVLMSNLEVGMVGAVNNYIFDIMTNAEPKDYEKIALDGYARRQEFYNREINRREEIRVKDSKPSLPLENYCGTYEDKMYGKAEVSLKNGKLFLQFIPTPTFRGELKHYQFDMFQIDWEDEFLTRGYIKFDMNFNGKVKQMTFEVPNSPDFIFTELFFEKLN
ncbi:MAG: serine hydrolase [Ignavibacteriae bacterium HGW-Ignavibacteriae-3]|nr:MAG: serine hydrolase [Ignavibacteriae bacterium HGW-Ignavibacteriae-3]